MKNLKYLSSALIVIFTLFLSACAPKVVEQVNIDPTTESATICVSGNGILVMYLPAGSHLSPDEVYVRVHGKRGEKFVVATDQGNTYTTELFSAVPNADGYMVTGDSYSSIDFLDNITVDTVGVCYSVGPDLNKQLHPNK